MGPSGSTTDNPLDLLQPSDQMEETEPVSEERASRSAFQRPAPQAPPRGGWDGNRWDLPPNRRRRADDTPLTTLC